MIGTTAGAIALKRALEARALRGLGAPAQGTVEQEHLEVTVGPTTYRVFVLGVDQESAEDRYVP